MITGASPDHHAPVSGVLFPIAVFLSRVQLPFHVFPLCGSFTMQTACQCKQHVTVDVL